MSLGFWFGPSFATPMYSNCDGLKCEMCLMFVAFPPPIANIFKLWLATVQSAVQPCFSRVVSVPLACQP